MGCRTNTVSESRAASVSLVAGNPGTREPGGKTGQRRQVQAPSLKPLNFLRPGFDGTGPDPRAYPLRKSGRGRQAGQGEKGLASLSQHAKAGAAGATEDRPDGI